MIKKILTALFVIVLIGCNTQAGPIDIRFTWTAPGDDGETGTCSNYIIGYSTVPITDANWEAITKVPESLTMIPNPAGTPETLSVTLDLLSDTDYYFRMIACDEVPNCSVLSNEVIKRTPDTKAPDAPIMTVDFIF